MPKQIPRELIVQKNKQNSGAAYIMLLDVVLNNVQSTRFHFARNHEDIIFLNNDYANANCVGHWKLDDNLATTDVLDASPNGNNGTSQRDTDIISVSATVDEGFDLDSASSDYVTIPDHSDYDFGALTLLAWVDPDAATPASLEHVLNRYDASSQDGYWISHETDGTWSFKVSVGGVTATIFSNVAASGSGQLIMATRDLDGNMKLYIDSVLQDDTDTLEGEIDSDGDLIIGADYLFAGKFNGIVDNVLLYGRDLSQTEAVDLHKDGTGTDKLVTTYKKANFEVDPIVDDNSGEITSIQLRISDIEQLLHPFLRDLDGAVGSTIQMVVVSSDELDSDYSKLTANWDILGTTIEFNWDTFTIGKPNPLNQRFPLYRYIAQHCAWAYVRQLDGNSAEVECNYIGETVVSITLPSEAEVIVEVTVHPWETLDVVRLETISGITPSLADSYQVTKTGANTFTLNGTDGDDFSGSYTSGGLAGYHTCKRTLSDCRLRGRQVVYGGKVGMRSRGIRVAR